jgi:formylglycine-generating enzyme required for sulfatase activity
MDYPWGDQVDAKKARYNSPNGPEAVGKFAPNDFGLYDMAGNVAEWTADWFDREYYKTGPAADPKGPETGDYKVIRGGAWSDSARRVTVFFRNWVRPTQRTPNIGFRCAQ